MSGGCLKDDVIKLVAYHLTKRNAELVEQLLRLEMIAPKKVRGPNGEVFVYRCPDELVPNPPDSPPQPPSEPTN